MGIERVIEDYHKAAQSLALGDPEPAKALYERNEDVVLAGPSGGFVRGWAAVSQALDVVAARFRDGAPVRFEEIAVYGGSDLLTLVLAEHWETKVGGAAKRSEFDLRVTSTFRLGDDGWKQVSRHADMLAAHQLLQAT